MPRLARLLPLAFVILSLSVFLCSARVARAEPAARQQVYVLKVESNGPDDQADALTTAIRSRVRAAGWTLQDSSHSFETLHITNCPSLPKPDATCLQKIGDQLKDSTTVAPVERFVWGTMQKSGTDQVAAELHLWQRGKPDVVAVETYSDNLKDPNDDALQKIAERIFAKLTGGPTTGTIVVHAGAASGAVFVDGVQKATLDNGIAKLEVPTGAHAIEVRVSGYAPSSKNVDLAPASEQDLAFELVAAKTDTVPTIDDPKSKPPIRKIVAYSAIGLGAASLIVGVVEGARFLSLKDDLNSNRSQVPTTVQDVCLDLSTQPSIDACNKYNDAKSARILEYVFLGVGAVLVGGGVVLLVTDKSGDAKSSSSAFHITPHVSPTSGGVDLRVTF